MTEIPQEYYCPKCDKVVSRKEVMPVVTLHYKDGRTRINRAFHWPNCKYGTAELEIRPGS